MVSPNVANVLALSSTEDTEGKMPQGFRLYCNCSERRSYPAVRTASFDQLKLFWKYSSAYTNCYLKESDEAAAATSAQLSHRSAILTAAFAMSALRPANMFVGFWERLLCKLRFRMLSRVIGHRPWGIPTFSVESGFCVLFLSSLLWIFVGLFLSC